MKKQFTPRGALTERQEEILKFIKGYIRLNRLSPTMREIAEAFGFSSINAAVQHVFALERKGWVGFRRNHGTSGKTGSMSRGVTVL